MRCGWFHEHRHGLLRPADNQQAERLHTVTAAAAATGMQRRERVCELMPPIMLASFLLFLAPHPSVTGHASLALLSPAALRPIRSQWSSGDTADHTGAHDARAAATSGPERLTRSRGTILWELGCSQWRKQKQKQKQEKTPFRFERLRRSRVSDG